MSLRDLGVIQSATPAAEAGYTALLAAARSSNASEGALYEDTDTGVIYNYYLDTDGPGILLPSWVYGRATGYSVNATGKAYMTLADDEDTDTEVTGRGWTIVETSGGTVTKAGGAACQIDSGTTNGGTAELRFTPTAIASTTDLFILLRLTSVSGSSLAGRINYAILDGTKYRRINFDTGTVVGSTAWANGILQVGYGTIDTSSDTWLWIYSSDAGARATNVAAAFDITDCDPADLGAIALSYHTLTALNTGGGAGNQARIDVTEAHIIEVSA